MKCLTCAAFLTSFLAVVTLWHSAHGRSSGAWIPERCTQGRTGLGTQTPQGRDHLHLYVDSTWCDKSPRTLPPEELFKWRLTPFGCTGHQDWEL